LELDGHVRGRARCEAEVVGEAVAEVGSRGLCGISVSGERARTVSPTAHCEPAVPWRVFFVSDGGL
jgi:hypothetical protein